MKSFTAKVITSFAIVLALAPPTKARAAETQLQLSTIIPAGTSGHECLLEMRDAWTKASAQTVKLTVAPRPDDGEATLVRKLRAGGIQAAVLSVVGLSEIDKSVSSLQFMPMMFRSWEEVDYVREKVAPDLESRLREKGFIVLFWADAGWVRFFSKEDARHPDDYKKMKMFVWAGDPNQMTIMRGLGYQPVSLETDKILHGLTSGMIDAVPVPPFIANAFQYHRQATHMLEVNWVPIVGAAVIRRDVWEKLPPPLQKEFLMSAREAGQKIRTRTRLEDEAAVAAMKKHGLIVQSATPQLEAEWCALAEKAYPKIRGPMVPPELFDKVRAHLVEFRSSTKVARQ